jgi:hypothetical protein
MAFAAAIVLAAAGAQAAPDAALALGPGTTFTSLVGVAIPADRTLYLSEGVALARLPEPVGSCRMVFHPGVRQLGPGETFRVRSVSSSTSPHADRGISTVRWRFAASDPVESLVCDTVGSPGPEEYDVRWSIRQVFSITPSLQVTER